MSRNGSGTYSLPTNSWNPAVSGTLATTADWQSLINDVASALTQSVSKDGQTVMTGSLNMGGFNLTNVASAAISAITGSPTIASPALTGVPTAPTATVGTSTDQIATTAFVAATSFNTALPGQLGNGGKLLTTDGSAASWTDVLSASSMNGSQIAGLRNKIINGNFDVWQRGTSFISSGVFPYTADRWAFYRNGLAAGATASRQTGVRWKYCLRVQRDSGNTDVNGIVVGQIIEGVNCYPLAGKTVVLRVRMRAGANFSGANATISLTTGTVEDQGNITNPGGWTGSTTAISSSVVPTTSFADYTATATLSSSTKEIRVAISYTPVGTAGAADYLEFEEVQLEIGSIATPFEHRMFGPELLLCQRYYYRITPTAVDQTLGVGHNSLSTTMAATSPFPVPMRSAPTALEQSGTAADYSIAHANINTACSAVPTFVSASPFAATTTLTVAAGLTAGQGSRARAVNSSAYLGWSAEL